MNEHKWLPGCARVFWLGTIHSRSALPTRDTAVLAQQGQRVQLFLLASIDALMKRCAEFPLVFRPDQKVAGCPNPLHLPGEDGSAP